MNGSKRGFLYDINDSSFNVSLLDALQNREVFVAGTSGRIEEIESKLSKLYAIEESVEQNNSINGIRIKEFYFDDGINFSATVSFTKKN